MPPKKRDKDVDSSKTPRTDTAQADHELFLQAFESEILTIFVVMCFNFMLFEHVRKNGNHITYGLWIVNLYLEYLRWFNLRFF